MPWRGPSEPGEFPTLGYLVADLIEAKCAIPDGDRRGKPFILTDEQLRFVLWFYRLIPPDCRKFVYDRGGQLCRPQKWGKGPLSAAIICAEADHEGPVRPDGCDADGEPVGKPWATPEIQVTGISEDNARNVWRSLVPMIELGTIAADIPDTGETRINLPGGGLIKPVTSAHLSRIGQKLIFAVQDQTESWTTENRGRALADVQRRNVGGMGGRFLETPNAWNPAEDSVAQYTQTEPGVLIDDVDPGEGSIRNKAERRKMLRKVYGDSWRRERPESDRRVNGHVDLDRIDSEIVALLPRDPAQAERWYLNRKRAAEDAAFDAEQWPKLATATGAPPADSFIVIGVHGARYDDSLVIVGTVIETGYQFVIGAWEAPMPTEAAGPAVDYEHPQDEIDGAMSGAMERFDVWRTYGAGEIEYLLEVWQGRWTDKRVLEWKINRPLAMGPACRRYRDAMGSAERVADLSHDGNAVLARHVANARRRKVVAKDEQGRPLWVVGKERTSSPLYVNGAIAAVLSWEARGDARVANAKPAKKNKVFQSW